MGNTVVLCRYRPFESAYGHSRVDLLEDIHILWLALEDSKHLFPHGASLALHALDLEHQQLNRYSTLLIQELTIVVEAFNVVTFLSAFRDQISIALLTYDGGEDFDLTIIPH